DGRVGGFQVRRRGRRLGRGVVGGRRVGLPRGGLITRGMVGLRPGLPLALEALLALLLEQLALPDVPEAPGLGELPRPVPGRVGAGGGRRGPPAATPRSPPRRPTRTPPPHAPPSPGGRGAERGPRRGAAPPPAPEGTSRPP